MIFSRLQDICRSVVFKKVEGSGRSTAAPAFFSPLQRCQRAENIRCQLNHLSISFPEEVEGIGGSSPADVHI